MKHSQRKLALLGLLSVYLPTLSVPTYSQYTYLFPVYLPTLSKPTYCQYTNLLSAYLPTVSIPTYSQYTYLLSVYLHTPSKPTYCQYTYLLSVYLPTLSIPTYSQYIYLLPVNLPTVNIPTYCQYTYLLSVYLPTLSIPNHLLADCHAIREPQPPETLRACPGLWIALPLPLLSVLNCFVRPPVCMWQLCEKQDGVSQNFVMESFTGIFYHVVIFCLATTVNGNRHFTWRLWVFLSAGWGTFTGKL